MKLTTRVLSLALIWGSRLIWDGAGVDDDVMGTPSQPPALPHLRVTIV